MRCSFFLLASALFADATVHAIAQPAARAEVVVHPPPVQHAERDAHSSEELWKRKGGGGGGGRGGGGGGGGRSSGSSSSGSRSGSTGRGSSSSNAGGQTTTGSGPTRAYGGGAYYGGGGAIPYTAGQRSRKANIAPIFLGVGLLAFWPGLWIYGAHLYDHPEPYTFYNASSQRTESKPVTCGCAPYAECGCDYEDTDEYKRYLDGLIGNGSYAALNKSVVDVGVRNGKSTILINGTLPNGTTAPGGTESPNAAGDGFQSMLRHAGWWPVVAAVCAMVLTI